LLNPTSFAFFPAPDTRILIAEKSGIVRIVKNGALLPTPFIDLSDRVNDYWDRGLLGIAVDPNFPTNPHVFLLYTYENDAGEYEGPKTARLTRVTVSGDTASPASEVVILGTVVGRSCHDFAAGADCIPSDGTSHTVGAVKFASDGTIFVTTGDGADFNTVNTNALRSLDLNSLAGKILRITRTGQGLSTNPYWTGDASQIRSKIWGAGVRNAFRMNLKPGTLTPYLGDVGWSTREEINVVPSGANLGWPCYEGSIQQAGYAPYPTCQTLYGPGGTPSSLSSVGTPIARVPNSFGLGWNLNRIKDEDKPPVGSGDANRQYDSYDGDNFASEDWVGYTFDAPHTFDRIAFQTGVIFFDGGWFLSQPAVQVLQNGTWVDVPNAWTTPVYAGNNAQNFVTYTFTFPPTTGTGIRLYGAPGGAAAFISVGEM
jgi:hypothetical protein